MAQIPASSPSPLELRLGADAKQLLNGGMSLKYDPSQLRNNQSPHMENMFAMDNGSILNKRDGQVDVFAASLGSGAVNGAYERFFMGQKIFSWGTGIYRQNAAAPVLLSGGLANARGTFFPFNGKLYYMNGTDFIAIDPLFNAAPVTPYIPTILLSTTPAGAGTPHEQMNLLTGGFKVSLSADGAATKYYLPFTNLDATPVTVTVNGVAKTEGVHFTVDRTSLPHAYVDFAGGSAPAGVIATGAPNNVIVTAYKTTAAHAERIKNCRRLIDYGGDNDTRLFAWGNPNYPNRVFRSGLLNGAYWPENEFSDVGSSSEAVVACAKHYDKLVYLKERSIAFTSYSNPVTQGFWGASQVGASFPLYWINGAIGCDIPGSVQIIDNEIVFGNSELGLFILVNVSLRDERNVRPISGNINGVPPQRPGLLDNVPANLQAATSVDFDGRYWLCVGSDVYVWDYRLKPFINTGDVAADEERLAWFPLTNINAACWVQNDRSLYYGRRDAGKFVAFQPNYNDFGGAINGVWTLKRTSFNMPDWLKTVKRAWFTAKAGGFSTITIRYISENGEVIDQEDVNIGSFRWDIASWATWTWSVNEYPPPTRLDPKLKKIVYFQIELSNNVVNQNLSLMSLVIQYSPVKKVK